MADAAVGDHWVDINPTALVDADAQQLMQEELIQSVGKYPGINNHVCFIEPVQYSSILAHRNCEIETANLTHSLDRAPSYIALGSSDQFQV